jgi:hypothetical protein
MGIRQYACFIRAFLNYDKLPDISQKQAEAIQQLTNGIYLEVKDFFDCFINENLNFKEGVIKYKLASKKDSRKKTNEFFEKKMRKKEADNKETQEDKITFREKFYCLLLNMKSETPVSSELLEYMDKFLMFCKREGGRENDQYKIFARSQVAHEVLLDYYHEVLIKMEVQEFIDLIISLQRINANPSMRGSIFEKLLIKSLCNAKSIIIENITLQGNNVKKINISFQNLPKIVKFYKFLPTNCDKDINYLYIPELFNYPLFDFFLVTKIDGYAEPCLICCSATIQSRSDHYKKDIKGGEQKKAAALQWYNFYKENKLSKIIEVYFIPKEKSGSESHTFVTSNQLIIDGVSLHEQFKKSMPFFEKN